MSRLTDKVSYLKGLTEGMKLNKEGNEGKMILHIIGVMEEMAQELERIDTTVNDLDEYMESIDEDLTEVEEMLCDEDYDDDYSEDEDDDEDDDDEEAEGEQEMIEYPCPFCGKKLSFELKTFDLLEDYTCPYCGKTVFAANSETGDDGDGGENG
ncbi:MAG: zinc ribbon domain-containing protein [Eubacteriales bacterium]|nr:zinc ribbon domain-containing protein [Eubacteriales bacterium]MDD3881687.1 zinc ribbon domain-containing protein [Eubacteriales bacterium]MDD4512254.1 zinc ribbon domain-containing protein [Eubacteriales bacterium]